MKLKNSQEKKKSSFRVSIRFMCCYFKKKKELEEPKVKEIILINQTSL